MINHILNWLGVYYDAIGFSMKVTYSMTLMLPYVMFTLLLLSIVGYIMYSGLKQDVEVLFNAEAWSGVVLLPLLGPPVLLLFVYAILGLIPIVLLLAGPVTVLFWTGVALSKIYNKLFPPPPVERHRPLNQIEIEALNRQMERQQRMQFQEDEMNIQNDLDEEIV